jgi:3-hydroxyisobutyrate dehydrogenase-like beta-hydroxyacid dehydrogenase
MGTNPSVQHACRLSLIGFGEAAQAFLKGIGGGLSELRGFDLKLISDDSAIGAAKYADFASFDVTPAHSAQEAVENAAAIFSLVTADQALCAAQTAAEAISPGAFYFDGNSVSPQTKRAAAASIEAAGGHYVDVAVMAPVYPLMNRVPMLVSGPHAVEGAAVMTTLGFNPRVLEGPVGAASAVKMIRSVMVKGVEALTAECLTAAVIAGVDQEVIASLDASKVPELWSVRGDYNLDRMMVHGSRRAEEMREVVATLEELGVTPAMSRGTVAWQAAIGAAGINPRPQGYDAKVGLLRNAKAQP